MISDTKGIELMRQNEQLVNHYEIILCFQVLLMRYFCKS